jgi:hypothetical protein
MKRIQFYFPLMLALLFGFALGTIPISPVFGETIPVCQGSGSSSVRVSMGGRVISPTTLLRTAEGGVCLSNETSFNMVTLTRTVVVSPKGSPTANGQVLLDAMNVISNSSPSATNPWLLKLEPGLYDLNGQSLVLVPYVDVEGSGEATTVISSSINYDLPGILKATVMMTNTTELRFVKVQNYSTEERSSAIGLLHGASNVRITNSTLSVYGVPAVPSHYSERVGIYNIQGNITVSNSTISASGADGDGNAAIGNVFGSVTIQGSNLTSTLMNVTGTLTIQNSVVAVSGDNSAAIYISGNSTTTILNSRVSAISVNEGGLGIFSDGGAMVVQNSIITGIGNGTGYTTGVGIFKHSGTLTVQNSVIKGSNKSIHNWNRDTAAKIGNSQLDGPRPGEPMVCVGTYDENFVPITSC